MSKESKKTKEPKLLYVSLVVSSDETQTMLDTTKRTLKKQHVDVDKYDVQRNAKDPAHLTLCYHSDFASQKEFEAFVDEKYGSLEENSKHKIKVKSVVYDDHCVAFPAQIELPFYPPDKNTHITMMLNKTKPVYSNVMLSALKKHKEALESKAEPSTKEAEPKSESESESEPKEIVYEYYSVVMTGTLVKVYSK